MSKFDLIILAAWLGIRLRPETYNYPKPLVQVWNLTLLDYTLNYFCYQAKIENIIISSWYKSQLIKNHCVDKYNNLNIIHTIEEESELTGPWSIFVNTITSWLTFKNPIIVTFCDYIYWNSIKLMLMEYEFLI